MDSPTMRRQMTLFVPEPQRLSFDAVRVQADPVQHSLIRAHVTLVRDEDVMDWSAVGARLQTLGPVCVELAVGSLQTDASGGAYLPLTGSLADFQRLREQLLFDQPGHSRTQSPHITLRHPRNRSSFGMRLAELREVTFPASVRFDQVALISQAPGQPGQPWQPWQPWQVLATSPQAS